MFLDGFGTFLVIFVQKNFLPLLKKFWVKNHLFGDFSKIRFLSQKSDYFNRFLVKFPFYTLLY